MAFLPLYEQGEGHNVGFKTHQLCVLCSLTNKDIIFHALLHFSCFITPNKPLHRLHFDIGIPQNVCVGEDFVPGHPQACLSALESQVCTVLSSSDMGRL